MAADYDVLRQQPLPLSNRFDPKASCPPNRHKIHNLSHHRLNIGEGNQDSFVVKDFRLKRKPNGDARS